MASFQGEDVLSYVQKETRIVLIGKTGSGKSSTANTLLGINWFKSVLSSVSITRKTSAKHSTYKGRDVLFIDTPGLFDTEIPNKVMKKEIMKCVALAAPGLHAVVLVTKIGRFTEEEKSNIEEFKKYFGEGLSRYLIIIFTGKDDLDASETSLKMYLENADAVLKQVVEECSHRCLALNNRASKAEKLKFRDEFFALLDETVKRSGGRCYTNDMLDAAEVQMKQAERKILVELEEEKRNECDEEVQRLHLEQKVMMEGIIRKVQEEKEMMANEMAAMKEKIINDKMQLDKEKRRHLVEAAEQETELKQKEEEIKQKAEEDRRKYEENLQHEERENALKQSRIEQDVMITELKRNAEIETKRREKDTVEWEENLRYQQNKVEKESRRMLAEFEEREKELIRKEEKLKFEERRRYEEILEREARDIARRQVEQDDSTLKRFIGVVKTAIKFVSGLFETEELE